MYYLDTETVGLTGPIVLLQYAIDDGPVVLYNVWNEPVNKTMKLIEKICEEEVCAFNLVFDWFHLCQMYNTLRLMKNQDEPPDITEYAMKEPEGRDGLCLKPKAALDLFLVAKMGPFQTLMERDDVVIKKVPIQLAEKLANELEKRIKIRDIYFGRRKDKFAPKWKIEESKDGDEDFRNVVLRFAPTSALKALIADIYGPDEIVKMKDFTQHLTYPNECGYAPFARALAPNAPVDWNLTWPVHIKEHMILWYYNEMARKYGTNDIIYLQKLWKFFGYPKPGHYNSELCIAVANARWKGFKINKDKIKALKQKKFGSTIGIPTAPNSVKIWIEQELDEIEKSIFLDTKKVTLETIAKWETQCPDCAEGTSKSEGLFDCIRCFDSGKIKHPAAVKAQKVIDARTAFKEIELFNKLLLAGRFHASFKVIGTLSDRMSGSDDLNPQGIKASDEVRDCFELAFNEEKNGEIFALCGGDFAGFEIVLADAVYADPKLRNDLLSGKKIHALFGQYVFTDMSYDEIVDSQGSDDDKYSKAKRAVFAMLYGGVGHTLKERLGVDLEIAEAAYEKFVTEYAKVGEERRKVFNMFCSMRQPGGIGSNVEWHEPSEYIESIYGFRRYFTLENEICKALFNLACAVPDEWKKLKVKVRRRDREQTASGATQSALYGAAFMIQAQSMRSACNHVIQSSGANLTKNLQNDIWQLQPQGIHPFLVLTLNCHDEIQVPCKPEMVSIISSLVKDFIVKHKDKVPLLKIDWKDKLDSWAGKH